MASWLRVRFTVQDHDARPVNFPAAGPWWVSGELGDGEEEDEVPPTFILIAYTPSLEALLADWPTGNWENSEIAFIQERDQITYTDRFPREDLGWAAHGVEVPAWNQAGEPAAGFHA